MAACLLYQPTMRSTGVWRALIIEDERLDREIYKRYLQHSSAFRFDFAEADSAAAGIEASRTWVPDCILLDFNLPDIDGLEVLAKLCGEGGRLPCAVIMLTAFGGEELAGNAMKSGVLDYLPKDQVAADILPYPPGNPPRQFHPHQPITHPTPP